MSHNIVLMVVVASVLALTLGDVVIPPQPPVPTTTAPTTTSTTTTTTKPTTTTTTTTTTEPTTTSTTTEPTTPSTTTSEPTTTTTSAPPTTTPSPPAPVPQVGNWTVYDEDKNITCIMAMMAIQLNVSYTMTGNKTGYAGLIVPSNTTTATGSCGNATQTLVLSWLPEGAAEKQYHSLTLTFTKNETTKITKLDSIDAVIQANVTEFPGIANASRLSLTHEGEEFATSVGMSYSCSKVQIVNLTQPGDNATAATLSLSHLRVEAFHTAPGAAFSAGKDCEPGNSPDIVPIAVGCALVGLVAIVLIAYLVGRRRSQARGYLSM